jgi:signal transduction histidine kinase
MNSKPYVIKDPVMRRVMLLIVSAFIGIVAILSFLFYRYTLQNYESSELMRLKGVANTLQLRINGDEHMYLINNFRKHKNKSLAAADSLYEKYNVIFNEVLQMSMLKSPIYTLTLSEDHHYYEFGVTSSGKPIMGDVYKTFPMELINMYAQGGVLPSYKDEYGSWLSAFAPIKDINGQTVALVMVDSEYNTFLSGVYKEMWKAILWSLLFVIPLFVMLIFIMKGILDKSYKAKLRLEETLAQNIEIRSALLDANTNLSKIDNLRKEMIANISHDLRTPLSSTIGYLELVKDDKENISSEKKQEYIQVAHKEAKRIANMVTDLFELSLLDSDSVVLHKEPIDLRDLVYDISEKYKVSLESKRVKLIYEVDDKLPLGFGDVKYVSRVFQNLLDNAVKYVYENGFIKLTITQYENKLLIKVCNNGVPLKREDLSTIFERYFKGENSSGGGLGLAISKKICMLHGNNIYADVNGEINSFWFTIDRFVKI